MAVTGTLTLNGIDDAKLVTILQVKEQFPMLLFAPQAMQPIPPPGPQAKQVYNNAQISWSQGDGLAAIKELLNRLTAP
jgi:hypothetical protein